MKETTSDWSINQMQEKIIEVSVDKLSFHPVLEDLPRLTEDQGNALGKSILANGILEPLAVIPDPEAAGSYLILDGRHRYTEGKGNGVGIFPCIVITYQDPLSFAIEKAVQGRQLTKSGVVLMLFLNHPDLAKKRGERAGRRPSNKGERGTVHSMNSYRALGERYKVPYQYFSILAAIHDQCSEEQWLAVKEKIFHDEIPITRIPSALAGEAETKNKKRTDPVYGRLAPKAATTIVNTFLNWGKIKWVNNVHRENTLQKFAKAFTVMPDEIRSLNSCAIVDHWPAHDQKRLFIELKRKLHK